MAPGPALELAVLDRPLEELEAVLAENIFQRGVVLRPPDRARAGGDVAGIRARVTSDGAQVGATDDPTALTGDLLEVVAHVADILAAFGETLRAGEVAITGAVSPSSGRPGGSMSSSLEPLGSLDVTFA